MLEILDQAFRVYREKFGLVLTIVGIGTVVTTALNLFNTLYVVQNLLTTNATISPAANYNYADYGNRFLLVIGWTVVVGFVGGLLNTLIIGAPLTYLTSERTLGRSVSIGQAYRAVRGRLLPVALGFVLFGLLLTLLVGALLVALFLCGFGFVVVVFVGLNAYAFLLPVLVLEHHGIVYSLRRAWSLAKVRFWPLLWMTLAVVIMSIFVSLALTLLRDWVLSGPIYALSTNAGLVVQSLSQAFIGMFIAPILPIAYTLMYYDTRVRVEGLDILLKSIDIPNAGPGDVPMPPPGALMVRQDWNNLGRLALLGLVPVVLYVCAIVGIAATMGANRP